MIKLTEIEVKTNFAFTFIGLMITAVVGLISLGICIGYFLK